MTEYIEIFSDIEDLFRNEIREIGLDHYIDFTFLGNNKAKEITTVVKANDLMKHLTEQDIIVIINQRVFEQLTDEARKMVVQETLAKVSFDGEKDKVMINKADINTYSLLLSRVGFEKYLETQQLINLIYAQIEDQN